MYDTALYKNQTIDADNIQSIFPSRVFKILKESSTTIKNEYTNISKTIDNPYDDNNYIFVRKQVLSKSQIDEINEIADEYGDLIGTILDRL